MRLAGLFLLWLCTVLPRPAQADIVLAGITEARGAGTIAGTSFRNGYRFAIEEINAAGGVLGQRLVLKQFDIDTSPAAAGDAAKQAVALQPLAVLGPVFTGLTMEAMSHTASPRVPHFTGSEGASVSLKFHPSILRTSLPQQESIPRLAAFVTYGLGARRVAVITIDNEYGRDGLNELSRAVARRRGELVYTRAIKPGTLDLDAVMQEVAQANPDALVLYVNEVETVAALAAASKRGIKATIVGDSPMLSSKAVEAASTMTQDVLAHAAISTRSAYAPMQKFVERYTAAYAAAPDNNSVKGYFAVQMLRAAIERAGIVDKQAVLTAIKADRFELSAYPQLMSSVRYNHFGNLDRESYFLATGHGKARLIGTVGLLDTAFVQLSGNNRRLPLDSDEVRLALRKALREP